jgi:Ca-activated chloride channel homolog
MLALVSLWCLAPPRARAWEPFRSPNDDVEKGNAELAKGQLDKALAAYNDAAKRLPQEPGVHLDRGIALLKAGKLNEARSALQIATQGSPPAEVRAKAQYNLGLSFLQEADAAAKQEDLEGAQKLLREASDAFKSSLRAGPGNRDAAWNYELAKRRQVELEKKQQEKKDQEKKDQEKKDQEKKDQDEQKQNDDSSDPNQDEDKQDGSKDPSQSPDAGAPQGEQDAGQPPQPEGQDGGKAPEPKQEPEPKDQPQQGQQDKAQPQLPEHMQKALDALESNDDNLQKHQAAQRARQRPQRVEKDW